MAHPSAINREVIRRTISYVRRALDPNPNVLLHGARLDGEAKTKANANTHARAKIRQLHHFPAQAAVLLIYVDPWTDLNAGAPIRDIPRIGSAFKPEGYSRHSPDQLVHFN